MASNVVLSSNFSSQKISFSQVKLLESGGKQAYVNYDGGMFVVQTPDATLPYGMNVFDKAGPVKYSVELSLRGYQDKGSKMEAFYNMVSQLDEFMIEQGVKNSKQWFKADLSRDVIKAFYSPMIRFSKDKDGNVKPYPPTLKASLRQKRDSQEFDVVCYDDKREQYKGIPLEELLVKGAVLQSLIQCTGVWFAGSKFGLSWKLVQTMIKTLPQSSRNFTFVDDDEELAAPPSRAAAPSRAAPALVEDEDDEDEAFTAPATKKSVVAAVLPKAAPAPPAPEEDEEADDAEPVPVPKAAKTLVKKKVVAKK
jgi:hypothetical protein